MPRRHTGRARRRGRARSTPQRSRCRARDTSASHESRSHLGWRSGPSRARLRILRVVSRGPASWSDPRLAETRFHDIRWFDVVDSTNRYLLECAAQGAPEGIVAVADEQTAGRGRLGRTFVAPPGAALLVSVLLRPQLPPERVHLLTLATALAAIDALPGVDARVKWPNDVVIDDRKLAGILAEADSTGAIVIGMGLNVRRDGLAPELREIATACDIDRHELL